MCYLGRRCCYETKGTNHFNVQLYLGALIKDFRKYIYGLRGEHSGSISIAVVLVKERLM